jgi:O-antigen ligase
VFSNCDQAVVLALTLSIFAPFYFSVVSVCCIAIMTMINCNKRAEAFRAPYTRFLFGFVIATFFVAATYGNYRGMLYSMLIGAAVVCALYVRSVMTRSLFNQVMDLACIGSLWCVLVAVVQKAEAFASSPAYRPVSVFTNANYFGMIIEFVVIIALYRIFTNPEKQAFYFAVIGCNLAGLYLCASMSSFVAMLGAVVVMLAMKKKYRVAAVILGVAGCYIISSLFLPSLFPRGSEALGNTLAERLSIWGASIRGIEQDPLLGRGAMAYQTIYEQFGSYKTYHCHNLLLDILLNFGFVGLGVIGFFALSQAKLVMLRFRYNICNNMNILLVAASAAVVIHGMTDVTIFWIQTAALFLLIYSSTGISSEYLERKLRLPRLLPEYAGEAVSQAAFLQ